ncbi:MAG: hypothetical protein ACI4V1_05590, partial [Eubacteriales bacterium]
DPNDFATGSLSDELYEQYFSPDYEAFAAEHISKTGATATADELFPEKDDLTYAAPSIENLYF